MLEEILALNRRPAARGDFEVACHLLMAAPHAADDAADEAVLARIGAWRASRPRPWRRCALRTTCRGTTRCGLRLQSRRQLKR